MLASHSTAPPHPPLRDVELRGGISGDLVVKATQATLGGYGVALAVAPALVRHAMRGNTTDRRLHVYNVTLIESPHDHCLCVSYFQSHTDDNPAL